MKPLFNIIAVTQNGLNGLVAALASARKLRVCINATQVDVEIDGAIAKLKAGAAS